VVSSTLDLLRPKPFRGDVIAAGVVVLTTLAWVVATRFDEAWGPGAHVAYTAVAWAFVMALGWLAPMEDDQPRAYQSVLFVASVALWFLLLAQLGRLLGADGAVSSPGGATWILALTAALALVLAVTRNSAVCTLLASLSGGLGVITGVLWLWDSAGLSAIRWVLLALMVVFGFLAIGQRDRRPRHGVALIDAAGLAVLAIALSFAGFEFFFGDGPSSDPAVAWGWELLIVAAGFGLIAYSSVDRQPGPAYLGVLNLIAFAVITSQGVTAGGATLVGWPIALALAATLLLALGLRPTTPAPPPPDIDAPAPPPLPLR
jgi:hypothetical protein